MPDLSRQIRDRLDEMRPRRLAGLTTDRLEPVKAWISATEAAIRAVLDVHKPASAGVPGKPHLADRSVCLDVGPEWCSHVGYPCETVEAIAKALRIKVDDD